MHERKVLPPLEEVLKVKKAVLNHRGVQERKTRQETAKRQSAGKKEEKKE